jgi:arsenate reductase-like glutaredoxin family protein
MNWLKVLVGLSAILVAGCAAYFSVTGLGVLFAGASVSVMVMAGSLELAKLVAATYLKQEWDTLKGFNKWYLTISVGTLMLITSAGIFGYLSNAFQQQNLGLQKIERDIAVYQTQITKNDGEIARYTTQLTNQQNIRNSQEANLSKQIDKDKSTSRVSQMIKTADKEIASVSKRIDELTRQNNVALDSINAIKNNNIELEREVGGFRFVAEAFGVPLNTVVKFFIFIIVIVFDPLAVALIIAFNGLLMKRKEEDDLSDWDATLGDGLDELMDENYKNYEVYGDKKRREDLLAEMMKNDQELGLYDEPITLSEKDSEVFFNEIENPSEPNEQLVNVATQYNEDIKKNETDATPTNLEEEYSTLTDEEKKALEPEITDEILLNLKTDYSERAIDLDGDGSTDGIDTDGDGLINRVIASHPGRAAAIQNMLPYYARPDFNWADRKHWINDQNAVNYWIKHIKPSQYPTDFSSKSY